MKGRGVGDLPGLTAQEIWDCHFRNELTEDDQTSSVTEAAGYLVGQGFDVWEYRSLVSGRTAWRDALENFWLVDHDANDIAEWN